MSADRIPSASSSSQNKSSIPEEQSLQLVVYADQNDNLNQLPGTDDVNANRIRPYEVKVVELYAIEGQLSTQLSFALKKAIRQVALELKDNQGMIQEDVVDATPISAIKLPEDRKRIPTNLVGEALVSFKLPDYCGIDAKTLDKFIVPEVGDNTTVPQVQNERKYNFSQRLERWRIERRKRTNGMHDLYYHHDISKRTFRSTKEIINFMLHETYPERPQKSAGKRKMDEDDPSAQKDKGYKSSGEWSNITRKIRPTPTSTHEGKLKEKMEAGSDRHDIISNENSREAVEKFMADAYNNLLNYSNKVTVTIDDSDSENTESDSYDEETFQTVEEFMSEAYNNLMISSSNNEPKLPKEENEGGKRSVEADPEVELEQRNDSLILPNPIIANQGIEQIPENQPKQVPENGSEVVQSMEENSVPMVINEAGQGVEPNLGQASRTLDDIALDKTYYDDLIDHIPESTDIFDLALFLQKNREDGGL